MMSPSKQSDQPSSSRDQWIVSSGQTLKGTGHLCPRIQSLHLTPDKSAEILKHGSTSQKRWSTEMQIKKNKKKEVKIMFIGTKLPF